MDISIFGLGYVGTVSAACMARDGHKVIGVDVNRDKVAALAEGRSTIIEPDLDTLLEAGVREGRIVATTDVGEAVAASQVSLISVGTPPGEGGGPDLGYVEAVCREIGRAVRRKGTPHVVVLRSTVPPGTLRRCHALLQEEAGDAQVHSAFNPEFLREGSAVRDYVEPPYTIIGTDDEEAEAAVRELYAQVEAPIVVVEPEVAEMIKYTANAWHATKIAFANEVGRIAHAFGVDGRQVMDLIAQDTKLNVSPAYMKPGFAYGGSCLPKDLASIIHYAQRERVSTPLLCACRRATASSSRARSTRPWRRAPNASASSGWPLNPTPTTCARARRSRSSSSFSVRAGSSRSTTPPSTRLTCWVPT
jgi:GDP-mannose 6-dehydrogenase